MIRNIDIVALRSFVTVAETGGVTRAAAKLQLSQPAVSMQLKRLEMAIGQRLVARLGRGWRHTWRPSFMILSVVHRQIKGAPVRIFDAPLAF